MEVHRGEVFYADLSPVVGSEQGGVRPVLIVQNEIGNRHSPTVIAAAITSRRALSSRDVMAAAITVGLCRLPISFWTMSTGRMPPCSEPTTGERSA